MAVATGRNHIQLVHSHSEALSYTPTYPLPVLLFAVNRPHTSLPNTHLNMHMHSHVHSHIHTYMHTFGFRSIQENFVAAVVVTRHPLHAMFAEYNRRQTRFTAYTFLCVGG